ncbi:hypothetical protein Tco_1408901 [Tanacetum coccineum]
MLFDSFALIPLFTSKREWGDEGSQGEDLRNKQNTSLGIGVYTDSDDNYIEVGRVNVRTLFTPGGNGIDVVVLVDSIRAISERLANTAYGFFLGEEGGISCYGLDAMLENGPWFIWNNPLILKKWHPDENLLKEDVSNVPVC